MAAHVCLSCGAPNRAGRKFCAKCGAALGVTCSSCGTTNEPGERFCGECGTQLDAAAVDARRDAVVERRLVSVLFADLVGFTPLAENRDAEDVRELLSRYFELAAAVMERYGGQVEKFIGDAVMAVWGTPVAQEDDAERAVRAALDLVDAVAEFGEIEAPGLAARAAVLTGEAAVNLGATAQGMVAGDLVNAASRAQAAAEPGTVLVGDSTRRATESAIAYAEAGAHDLKGKIEPLPLWRALRVTAARGGMKTEGLEPPFVGRDRELRLLKELFHSGAEERKGHLVSILGIAGIGKSRLAWELYKYLDGITQEVAWHSGRCLAYGDGVTYWALAEMVRMRAGIAEREEPEAAQSKLDEALSRHIPEAGDRAWIRPRVGQLLSLEANEHLERADLFAGWRLFFERIAERTPVVLVFEDMQWADPPLLEFVEHLLDASRSQPIFIVALARPELAERHPHWPSGVRNATTLALEPLSGESMEALVDGYIPGLPDELKRQILERSEGVPLYAVETVRMLLDRGLVERVGATYLPTGSVSALEVPETLRALVAARLDGLPNEERSLVHDASVLGKTFTRAALAAVSGRPEAELEPLLAPLIRKEILSLEADPRSPERGQYGFVQDLLRQVAYETLPRRERKRRHLDAAAYLEREWLAVAQEDVVEIVASHLVSALDLDPGADDAAQLRGRAETTLARAAERAEALGAPDNALRYLEHALALAESPLRRAELRERAGQMAVFAGSLADGRSHLERAITEFEALGLTHPAARVKSRLAMLTWTIEGDIGRAIDELEPAFAVLADDEPDADLGMLAVTLARPLLFSGRHDDAMARNELALQIAESLQLPEVLSHGLNTKAVVLSMRGRHEEAELLARHSLEVALANELSTPAIRAYGNLTSILVGRDRYREALELSLEGRELARKIGDRSGLAWIGSWVRGLLGILGEWDAVLADEVETADERSLLWTRLASAFVLLHKGELEEVRRRLEAILESVDVRDLQNLAGLRSLEAELLLRDGKPHDALAAAEEVIGVEAHLAGGLATVSDAVAAALEAAFAVADEAKVDELLARIEQLPPGDLTALLRGIAARFSAQRAAVRGEGESAAAAFVAAARVFAEIERPFDAALVRLEHAEWLAGEGRLEKAEPLLAAARATFERLGATPYLARVEGLAPLAPVRVGSGS